MSRLFPFLLLPLAAGAQPLAPGLGAVVDPAGRLCEVRGTAGALTCGPVEASGVLSVYSTRTDIYWKTRRAVRSWKGESWPAPPGPALFAFTPSGRDGAIWFEQASELHLLHDGQIKIAAFPLPGRVRGLAMPDKGRLVALLESGGALRRVEFNAEPFAVLRDEPSEPGVLLENGTLFRAEGESSQAEWRPHAPGWLSSSDGGVVRLLDVTSRTIFVAPPAADGPLTLSTLAGGVETPVVSTIDFGQTAPSAEKVVMLRVRNVSAAVVTLQRLSVSGSGFSFYGSSPDLPLDIKPGLSFDVYLRFRPSGVGGYAGQFTVNSGIYDLRGSGAATVVLQRQAGSSWVDIAAGAVIDLGSIPAGTSTSFPFQLANPAAAELQAGPVSITGSGARLNGWPGGVVTVAAGAAVAFTLVIDTTLTGTYLQTLSVGSSSYSVRAVVTPAVLPRPRLTISSLKSGEQVRAGLKLDSASPVDIDGKMTMVFTPVAGAGPDPAIQFLPAGGTVANFHLTAGSTVVSFAGSSTVLLQTGSTAGKLTFKPSAGTQAWEESIDLVPSAVILSEIRPSLGTQEAGLAITGIDNNRTAGSVQCTFYLTDGSALPGGSMEVSVADAFRAYYAATPTAAGTFLLKLTFPVSGTTSLLGGVDLVFVNGVGATPVQRVTFTH